MTVLLFFLLLSAFVDGRLFDGVQLGPIELDVVNELLRLTARRRGIGVIVIVGVGVVIPMNRCIRRCVGRSRSSASDNIATIIIIIGIIVIAIIIIILPSGIAIGRIEQKCHFQKNKKVKVGASETKKKTHLLSDEFVDGRVRGEGAVRLRRQVRFGTDAARGPSGARRGGV